MGHGWGLLWTAPASVAMATQERNMAAHTLQHTHAHANGDGGGGRLLEMIAIRKVNELEVGGKGGLSFKGQFRLKGGRGKLEGPNLQQRIAISAIRG